MERPWTKYYEAGVSAHLAYPSIPIHKFLDNTAAKYPDRPAMTFGAVAHALPRQPLMDTKYTYRQLREWSNRFANALITLGLKKGDRVALYLPNCPQFVLAYYGILRAGGVVAPINPIYTPRELEHQLNDSGAETILVLSQFYPKVQEVRSRTKLKNVIVTNIKEYFPGLLKFLFGIATEKRDGHKVRLETGDYWLQSSLKASNTTSPNVEVKPEDTAVLMYTGGTTGVPKAAQLLHSNLVANTIQVRNWLPRLKDGEEVVMTALPLFHSFAMTTCMNAGVYLGSTMILVPNPRDLTHVMKSIDAHAPTLYPGVPTMYISIINYPDLAKYNIKSIKACVSGAAGLPPEVQRKFQELTGAKLVEGYGLSEASPVTHANPIYGENRIGTIGLPYPDTDAKIVDVETGQKEVSPGESGELIIRGPQVMKGYWNRPDETADTLQLHDGEYWLHTGDIAVMDQDGYFKIVDRKKEMIITGGFNVYPREIEDVLYMHQGVLEAAVIGVKDEHSGERVKAFVVLKPDQRVTADDLFAHCRNNLAPYKVPKYIEFRQALPKTIIGKILRRELAEEERSKKTVS